MKLVRPIFSLDLVRPPKGSRNVLRLLHRQLRTAITSGRLRAGLKLPSTRDFAKLYGVSRNTALALYELLLGEGFLTSKPGSGTFVSEVLRRQSDASKAADAGSMDSRLASRWRKFDPGFGVSGSQPVRYDLRLGSPDQTQFPFDIWRRLSNRALRELAKSPATYLDAQGPQPLRAAISRHVSFTRAVACSEDDIVITTGAQQGFDLIARILVNAGETVVAVEDPGYPPLRAAFVAAGAVVRPVPVDADGLQTDGLPPEARVVCVTPSHQFPTSVAMSLDRRVALLDFARARKAVVVEDDYDGEFRFDGRSLDTLQTLDDIGCVFYVGTFSKSLFPALRLGYVVTPTWARAAFIAAKRLADWHGPALPQSTLAIFIEEGHLARHIRRMHEVYGERRAALLDALPRHCGDRLEPFRSGAGLHQAARLKGSIDASVLVAKAAAVGVGLEALSRYAVTATAPNGLALGYGAIESNQVDQAIRTLAKLLG